MSVPNRQIGWSQESNLLWYILSQLKRLASVIYGMKPKYKVFTATLTQAGGDSPNLVIDLPLTIGVTYEIIDNDGGTADFTNVGAPNNNVGTFFIATGTTPNSWGDNSLGQLQYNEGAPIANVLENTIGNVWFTYDNVGMYFINSNGLFTQNKTFIILSRFDDLAGDMTGFVYYFSTWKDVQSLYLNTGNDYDSLSNDRLINTPIEIRVYN
jgi:hypothetical protein